MRAPTLLIAVAATVAGFVCAEDNVWWESALIYQIYPRSFKDSNGDGIGDLNGITEKLPYLKDLGVDAIWLSPIYLSPMYDFGYDIADYREIAPEYGTMDDFHALMGEAKRLGVRVVLDYVPNHTSNESDWFVRSARREPGYEDFYIWADGKEDPQRPGELLPPNNWVSIFRKSAWEYHPVRQQFYLHQFLIGQPDLNYRSARVQGEMKDVLRFWLDKGVSGFRLDAINLLFELDANEYNGRYPDEPLSGIARMSRDDYGYLDHIYTRNLNETYDVVHDWRDLLEEYREKDGESRLMMAEAYAELSQMIRYYGNSDLEGAIPFNFLFLEQLNNESNARDFKLVIDKWITYMPIGKTANWVNGNHDQSRVGSRHGVHRVDAMNMLALILPGITFTYQGEEIGMTDGDISWEETKDPQACNTDDPINYWKRSRDPERTPFHWDSTRNAGFSSTRNHTWLPLAGNYMEVNLDAEMKAVKSHYKFYRDVAAIKKSPAVRHGDLDTRAITEHILVVTRLLPGRPGIIGVINLSDKLDTVNLSSIRLLPNQLKVAASGVACILDKGHQLQKNNISISAHCALVLETVSNCC